MESRKTQRRNRRKAKVVTETLVPDANDAISYLTNDTKVKISVSPKEIWNKHLEDSSIIENFITNTTRVEETAVCLDMEKLLETSNFVEKFKARLTTGSRISHGSEGTSSSSDDSHQLKSSSKGDHLSNSKYQEPTNSKNGVNIVIPLKGKKKQTCCIKPQAYDDALDITEHHTHSKNEGDLGNSTESSNTSFIKHKAPEHKLKKKKISVMKQDFFDVSSPTVLPQTKQIVKDTPSKNSNLNTDSGITNRCDQPKIFESSTDSIVNMKPKSVLRKKASRAHGKNGYESLMMATYNNIEPIAGIENKTGYISSESASSIAPAAVAVRHNFKKIPLKRRKFDSAVENPVVEDPVQNIQPNVNDLCSSRQQSKDISAELDVLEAPAKIVGKINKKHLQHNLFGSVVGNEESVQQNVEEQQSDIASAKNYTQNTFAANVSADIDDLKAAVYPKIVGKINKKHLQHNLFGTVVGNEESVQQNVEEQQSDIALAKNYTRNTFAANVSADITDLKAAVYPKIVGKINEKHLQHNLFGSVVGNEGSVQQNVEEQQTDIARAKNCTRNTSAANVSADIDDLKAAVYPKIVGKVNKKHLQHNFFESDVGSDDENVEGQNSDIAMTKNCAQNTLAANTKESTDISTAQKFVMNVLNKEKCGSIPPQTFKFSEIQGCSRNSQGIEGRRQMNEGDLNSSVNKLVERKFLPSVIGTSVFNSPILPEFGRSTDSPGDSLTVSKFRPKITSSKIYLAKDGIAEQYPRTSAAVQQKVASNTFNLTHNKQQIGQSDNPTDCQAKSTDNVSDETNYKKRKKSDSISDNSLPSSDLTFEPDNVPHSTMVQSSSKKKCPPPAMHKIANKTKRSLLNSFQGSAEVFMESGKKVSVETENVAVRITSNGRESENELAVETKRHDNGTRITLNEHYSKTVEDYVNFTNKISVPENLYAVSDHEPFAGNISTNFFKSLNLMSRPSSTSDNDVSQVLSRASHKTKSLAKSSSVNSQEELINADNKNEKKQQGNSKNVSGKLKNSPENIVCGEIINPQSMGGDTKCSVSLPCMGKVSSNSISKTHENSHGNAEIKQISLLDTAQKMCSLGAEEINPRKSDRVSLRAERRKSSSYSFAAVSYNKLNETDVLASRKNSNLKSRGKVTGNSIENTSYNAEAPNFREELPTGKETPELRGLASLSLSASHLNETSRKETSLNFKNKSKGSIRVSNKNATVSNVTNGKIIYSNSPDLCNANNDKRVDDYLKEGLYPIRQIENERGSHTDTQPHLTEADDADGAPGENSVISGEVRELSPLLSASQVNTSSHKENFSPNFENSSAMKNKEISKNVVISNLSNATVTHSDSSGVSNANNDKRPYLKDSLHRNRQTGNGRQSNTDNQPQLIEDNDGAEGKRSAIISQPLKDSILITHQKKIDVKQTQAKPTARACFLIDGEQYKKPKLVRPKCWINQRFYNYVLPKFDKQYGLCGTVKCEKFVELLCNAVTACISNRKNWDLHVDKVQEILHEHLSINNFIDFLTFAEQYLPDEFLLKVGLTYEKRCKNK